MSAGLSGEKIEAPFYVRNADEWIARKDQLVITDGEVEAPAYEDALLLPPRAREMAGESRDGTFEGGVCTADGGYVAGHLRRTGDIEANMTCWGAYEVEDAAIVRRDEDVIFGGFVFSVFGHQLTESMARLWYVVEHPEDARKVVLLALPQPAAAFSRTDFQAFLDLMGIPCERVEVIDRPTRFSRVTVPDQAFTIFSGGDTRYMAAFRAMRGRAQGPTPQKVYLSRGRFARKDYVNERFLEEFHRKRGFEIVYPETLSLEEQVSVVGNAEEVATTLGTMSHLFLFAGPEAELTIYLRADTVMPAQLAVDKVAGRTPVYVDVTCNLLPTHHMTRAHLFGPNRFFRAYLHDRGIECTDEELRSYAPSDEDVLAYLRLYDKVSQGPRIQKLAVQWDMSDVLAALHAGLNDVPASPGDYRGASANAQGARLASVRGAFRLVGCAWEGDSARLRIASPFITEGFSCNIVMVAKETGMQRAVPQSGLEIRDGAACVTLDLRAFFEGFHGSAACGRWDVFIEALGAFKRLNAEPDGTGLSQLSEWFLYEDGRLLAPHVSDGGVVCLWYVGTRRSGFSKEFFGERAGRSLANDLLQRLVRLGRWEEVGVLCRQARAGAVLCRARPDGRVLFCGRPYGVGALAYRQAAALAAAGGPGYRVRCALDDLLWRARIFARRVVRHLRRG